MKGQAFIFLICITSFLIERSLAGIFDVTRYGASGDGVHDDTQAFKQVWRAACSDENPSILIPSERSFLVGPITFQGPCKSTNIHIQLTGSIVAPKDPEAWTGCENVCWIYFTGVAGLFINGSGTINGNGQRWWDTPSRTRVNGTCTKPTVVQFNYCNGLRLNGIKLVNSSRDHIILTYNKGVTISNIHISAPNYSRNTDGIDIFFSSQVQIRDSIIQTGDDCIGINTGCSDINITGIRCGPGHGISIGSLGPNNTFANVENVYITNCHLEDTQNGVRIKSWQGGSGYARSIHFENINLKNVENPIIIDQNYCNGGSVYVAGDSYAGIGIPIISQLIANGNEKGLEPFIDLKGYLLGNPATFHGEYNYRISYAHGVGLISDELFESLKRNCKGEYFDIHPRNTQCWNDRQTYDQMLGGITHAHILEPKCEFASPRPQKWIGQRRSLDEMLYLGRLRCRFDWEKISYHWADDDKVREALHVQRGSIGKWKRCAGDALPYQKIIGNSIPYHANLSGKGYRSLIYSGDHDTMIPYTSTEAWIRSLNYSIVDDWRPWIVDGQVAGYTRTYSNKMTFATVKGGGHTAPEYKPVECLAMLRRWLSYQPL